MLTDTFLIFNNLQFFKFMGGIFEAGASIISSIVGGGFQLASQNSANSTNIELAKMQNQWNLDQWNRENEYNLPKNQMARLAAAGLNPYLIYGNGAGNLRSASSPQAAKATVQAANLAPFFAQIASAFIEAKKLDLEQRRVDAGVDFTRSQTATNSIINAGLADRLSETLKSQRLSNTYQSQRNSLFEYESNMKAVDSYFASKDKELYLQTGYNPRKSAASSILDLANSIFSGLFRGNNIKNIFDGTFSW